MKTDFDMQDYIKEHGGYYACSFKTAKGTERSGVLTLAKSAKDARARLTKLMGCVLVAFTARAVCP